MEINTIQVPIFDWTVIVFSNMDTPEDYTKVRDCCNDHLVDMNTVTDLMNNIEGKRNNASHLCNKEQHTSFLFYNKFTSMASFWYTFPHEIGHLIDYMSDTFKFDTEAASYVRGWIYRELHLQGVTNSILKEIPNYE